MNESVMRNNRAGMVFGIVLAVAAVVLTAMTTIY